MQAAPLPVPVAVFAADFSRRFGFILTALAALIARRFLREPRLVTLIVPLWNRLTRAACRCERLMARVATGRLPRPSRPGRSSPHLRTALPRGRGWLVRTLGWEAAGCASQLESLLAEPAAAELLALAPSTGRIIRPIAHLLGIRAVALPAPPRVRQPFAEPESDPPGLAWREVPTPGTG